jgi:hypothetical protein
MAMGRERKREREREREREGGREGKAVGAAARVERQSRAVRVGFEILRVLSKSEIAIPWDDPRYKSRVTLRVIEAVVDRQSISAALKERTRNDQASRPTMMIFSILFRRPVGAREKGKRY